MGAFMAGVELAREQAAILLESARLRLRRFTAADLDLLVELDSDPEVMRWISYGVPTPRERYEHEILPRWFAQYQATPLLGYWAAESRDDGAFVGWFHLRPDRIDDGEQELGYRLRRAAWGQGLATEGSVALLDHGFRRVGTDRISARTLAGNHASQRVMQKCGLRYERDFVYPEDVIAGRSERERTAVKYSLGREDWLRRPA
jgi:RimJ/RimL family protein N-acetyltransferase